MNVPLFICVAEDTIKARPLHLSEKLAYVTQANKKGEKKKKNNGSKLPDMIEIVLGVKVMVTINVDTDKSIANGSCGEIIEIMLNMDEPALPDRAARIKLHHLPACVLIKLDHPGKKQVGDLESGVVPIFPEECTYRITMRDSKTKTVK